MNFSVEQIQKVKTLRIEFVEKLQMFAYGISYAKHIYSINEEENENSWIDKVIEVTKELKIEEYSLGKQYILTLQEKDFYKALGEYFKKIEEAFYKQNNEIVKPFNKYFYDYKKQIISLLVM